MSRGGAVGSRNGVELPQEPTPNDPGLEGDRLKRADREANRGRKVEDSYFGEDPLQYFRRFAEAGAPPREPEALLCRHLRSREWSVTQCWIEEPDAPFCCLKTLREWGPDGARALIDVCNDERACFEPANRSRESES